MLSLPIPTLIIQIQTLFSSSLLYEHNPDRPDLQILVSKISKNFIKLTNDHSNLEKIIYEDLGE